MPEKVLLLGDTGVGKTVAAKYAYAHPEEDLSSVSISDLKRFEPKHNPTVGVEVHHIDVPSGNGTKRINVWDCGGDSRFRGLEDAYYIGADACIIVGPHSEQWKREFRNIAPNAPILHFSRAKANMFQEIAQHL